MNWYEPDWAIATGNRLGQWLYKSLPEGQRWNYLLLKCNGKSHAEALDLVEKKVA